MEFDETLDCKGLSCPMPILKLAKAMKKMKSGNVIQIFATDPGSKSDIPKWCQKTGNEFLGSEENDSIHTYYIRKQ